MVYLRNLKGWRELANITQQELADSAGVYIDTIRDHEQEKATDVSLRVAMDIARVLSQKLPIFVSAELLAVELDWSVLANAQRRTQVAKKKRKKKPSKKPAVPLVVESEAMNEIKSA